MFRDYNILSNAIGLRSVELVSILLQKHSDIDIMHFDGSFLRLAIEGRNSNTEITKLLLDYFKNVQLAKLKEGSKEYNNLEHKFKTYLKEAIVEEQLSHEMMAVLSDYINTLGEKTSESELESKYETDSIKNDSKQNNDAEYDTSAPANNLPTEEMGLMYGNLTDANLNKNYKYLRTAREAQESYDQGLYDDCIDKITDSAASIHANKNFWDTNTDAKGAVLYKYLCFYNDDKIASRVDLDDPWKLIDSRYIREIIQNAICDSNYDIVEQILDKMPSIANVPDKYGQTPLHWATHDSRITELLLEYMKTEVILKQAEGNNNYTALHIAVHYNNRDVTILLLNKIPELATIQDIFAKTPLDWASDNPEITAMFVNIDNSVHQSLNTAEPIIDDNSISHDNVELAGIEHYSSSQEAEL